MTDPPSDLVERSTRIVLRPIANPLPVGFLALAAGSFLVSAQQLHWFEPVEASRVALFLIGFVAPLQLLAAIFGYLGRDIVAGTGMAILAGTWFITGLILQDLPPGGTSDVLGASLLMSAIAMLLPAAAASGAKLVPALVISTTATRFALTGVRDGRRSGWPGRPASHAVPARSSPRSVGSAPSGRSPRSWPGRPLASPIAAVTIATVVWLRRRRAAACAVTPPASLVTVTPPRPASVSGEDHR